MVLTSAINGRVGNRNVAADRALNPEHLRGLDAETVLYEAISTQSAVTIATATRTPVDDTVLLNRKTLTDKTAPTRTHPRLALRRAGHGRKGRGGSHIQTERALPGYRARADAHPVASRTDARLLAIPASQARPSPRRRAHGRTARCVYPRQSGSDGREETPTMLFNPRSRQWMPDHSS